MKAYRDKEAKLDKTISSFLVTKYGSTGDPPPKQKQSELVMKLRRMPKKIDNGKKEKD